MRRKHHRLSYFTSSFGVVLGLVLIWRGIWYGIDLIDMYFFDGGHDMSTIGGILLGFLILYLPDRSLSEIKKL